MKNYIKIENLEKSYGTKKNPLKVLGPVNLTIAKGSFTLILGRSGSGKSTLLNLMAGLDKPSCGILEVAGEEISSFKSPRLAKYRSKIGIVFQFYNLLPNLSTEENVLMGAWAGGNSVDRNFVTTLLEKLKLGHRLKANVKTLSGGEKQRVAIARSLINNPEILFCDEPTGALDLASEKQVQEILSDINKKEGKTIVVVTHNPDFRVFADKVITMNDGMVSVA